MEYDKVYIAGPMSGIEEYNKPSFDRVEQIFLSVGYPPANVFNPIKSEISLKVQQGLISEDKAYSQCLRVGLDWICDHATMVYMLRGWENSKGARAEHATALALGITIEYQ